MTLKISISGVRGIWGDSLTANIVRKFGLAFCKYFGDRRAPYIIVAADTRNSGAEVKEELFKGLHLANAKVLDVGILPTPTVQVITKEKGADGAIIISASHNPKQWNGLKFVRSDGIFLSEEEATKLISIYEEITEAEAAVFPEGHFDLENDLSADKIHLNKIIEYVGNKIIQKSNLRVVIDSCCGAGANITPKLLDLLGVEYEQINSGIKLEECERGLEPITENLKELGAKVKEVEADIGFAQDPDADRLAIVNEKGEAIGEDYTLCLISDYLLSLVEKGNLEGEKKICTNLSTTRIIDDVAKKHDAEVIRTKIGEVNVSIAMKKSKAVTGGEGNGGIMVPAIGLGRDSLVGIALMLQYLAISGKKVSELVDSLPKYVMYKDKIECISEEQVNKVLANVKNKFADEKIDDQDGIKIIFGDGNWLHVRASNTEPIIRLYSEAESLDKAKELVNSVK